MTLKEYLISHPKEIEKAITMMVEKETHVFSGEPLNDEEKDGFRQNLEFFAQNLLNLDPNMDENESIILFMPIRDNVMDEEEYIASSIYRKKDLDEYPGLTGIPEDPDSLSDDEVKQWMDKIKEHPYITSYGYEFSPGEDWL